MSMWMTPAWWSSAPPPTATRRPTSTPTATPVATATPLPTNTPVRPHTRRRRRPADLPADRGCRRRYPPVPPARRQKCPSQYRPAHRPSSDRRTRFSAEPAHVRGWVDAVAGCRVGGDRRIRHRLCRGQAQVALSAQNVRYRIATDHRGRPPSGRTIAPEGCDCADPDG